MNNNNDNISMIWQIMLALESSDQPDVALNEALGELKEDLGAEDAALWMLNEQENRLYAVIHSGENSIAGFSTEVGTGIAGTTAETGEPLFIEDTAGDPRFPNGNDEITGVKTKNVYCVPMKLKRKTVGCLQIINKENGEYSDSEKNLCRTFAGLSAMVIDEKGFTFSQGAEKNVIMSLRGIVKEFKSGSETLRVLKGVDMDIYENEFLVILGESGCGKSTMLNIIGGMDSMSEGSMTVDGKDFSHPTESELTDFRRDYIGFIFQAYNLMPNLTALENIEFIAENCPSHGDPKEALDMVGLSQRAGNYPSMMSGGQQQRVSIARAIVKNPKLILADEPTAALDFTTGQEVLRVIEKLVKQNHTTVVMVTHNIEIAKMANRVVRFKNGRIASIRVNAWPLTADEIVW